MRFYVRIPKHSSPPPQEQEQKQKKEKEPKVDKEGLLLPPNSYDVILIGTGLIQSILASALSRVGLSILHCDGNDFYGELDGILNLKENMMDWVQHKNDGEGKGGDDDGIVEDNTNIKVHNYGSWSNVKVHSCTDLSSFNSSAKNDKNEIKKGALVSTPYGIGTVLENHDDASIQVSLHQWKLANGSNATAYFSSSTEMKIIPPPPTALEKLYHKKRYFNLDVTPGLLYASCNAVQGILDSGIGDYVEFKSILGLLLLTEADDDDNNGGGKNGARRRGARRAKLTSSKASSTKAGNEEDEGTSANNKDEEKKKKLKIMRVPCSKNDVFSTKLLSPSEKRRLMKFLQLALDYAHATTSQQQQQQDDEEEKEEKIDTTSAEEGGNISLQEEYVTSLNERQLNQGRSLSRPQNKVIASKDMSTLLQCIQDKMDFNDYLEKEQKLDDKLRQIVIHALCLGSVSTTPASERREDERNYDVEKGMNDLCRHLISLGRYGGTAFLCPLYGCGELSQSFCRSGAVHGGIYLLRRPAKEVLVRHHKKDGKEEVHGIVLGGDNATLDENGLDMFGGSVIQEDKVIYGKNIIVANDSLLLPSSSQRRKKTTRRILRRISIIQGKLIPSSSDHSKDNDVMGDEQRYIIVITPQTGNLKNENVIHGVVIDESVFVSPSPSSNEDSYTVLHLTTTVGCGVHEDKEEEVIVDESVLERAVQSLIESRKKGDATLEELYHVSFSYPDLDCESNKDTTAATRPKGLHICDRPSQTITVDAAFREAERIFYNICSLKTKFLVRSEEIDKEVQERIGNVQDIDDDEGMMLESALNMIGSVGE